MRRYMIDLETFGVSSNACIVQIGVCRFDMGTGEILETLKLNVDAQSAVANGAVIDGQTVYWWLKQSEEARKSVTDFAIDEKQALMLLNAFLDGADEVWSHTTFDFVLITGAMQRHGIKPKFSYRSARDIRTLVALAPSVQEKQVRTGTHHDALEDAKYQVQYCSAIYRSIK